MEGCVCIGSAVYGEVILDYLVRLPDRGKARRLGGHNVDTAAHICGKRGNAVTDELKHGIFYKIVGICRTDKRDRNVLRADAGTELARKTNSNNIGIIYIIGLREQLLYKLGAALADCHGTERTVTGVAVGAEKHSAAAAHRFAHKRVDDRLMRGNVDTAVLLCGGKAEEVVVLVYSAAYGAKAVMAVCENVGQGEFGKSACTCGLNDADVGNVVRCERIKLYFKLCIVSGGVVRGEDGICHRSLVRLRALCLGESICLSSRKHLAVLYVYLVLFKLDHNFTPRIVENVFLSKQGRIWAVLVFVRLTAVVIYFATLARRVSITFSQSRLS